jgi:transposase
MSEMVSIPEIAKRLKIDGGTVRRFIAREKEELKIVLHRGKGDKLLLSREDADRLISAYESRRGPIAQSEDTSKYKEGRCSKSSI